MVSAKVAEKVGSVSAEDGIYPTRINAATHILSSLKWLLLAQRLRQLKQEGNTLART